MSIKTIVFDFGNVVGLFSHRQAAEQLAAYAAGNVSVEEMERLLFRSELGEDYEAGRVSSDAFMKYVCKRYQLACTPEEFAVAYSDMFAPNPDVCALLPRLKPHYRLLLLSNTTELHSQHFLPKMAEQVKWFDHVVLSHAVGHRKPRPEVYRHCERLSGSPPAECLFIDDVPENVEGAKACGWHGIVYKPGDDLPAALRTVGVEIPARSASEGL
jgi:putative hydrolase of the HAD superfamily